MVDSKIGPDTKRVCRCGAGTEKTPGKADTPGFELNESDIIEEETFKGVKILRLKRNERRMKQTSFIQLHHSFSCSRGELTVMLRYSYTAATLPTLTTMTLPMCLGMSFLIVLKETSPIQRRRRHYQQLSWLLMIHLLKVKK